MAQSYRLRMSATSQVILGVVILTLGCAIYLLFRTKTLYIYQWCSTLGLSNTIDHARASVHDWNIPDFIKFSLPDGLYCAAYILFMDAIWKDDEGFIKHFVISLVPIITITCELLQYFGLVNGTFDCCDLVYYSAPFIAYHFYRYFSTKLSIL